MQRYAFSYWDRPTTKYWIGLADTKRGECEGGSLLIVMSCCINE